MFKRSLAGVALVIGLGTASLSHALSLGELRLNSALNQPFGAEIPLKDAGNLSEEQITIKLASVDDFEKAGVDYSYLLSNLVFSVSVSGNGKGLVQVTSREPIVEPYLNFLIEARWPTGRMLREYIVLLDLPAVSDAKTSTVTAAQGGAATQAVRDVPATREEVVILEETLESEGAPTGPQKRADGERTSLPQAEMATEYRVQHNDMLWNIASEYRPDGATVQQTMLALLRKNPRAFIGDNINRLKSGYVLRLPTADEARSISQEDSLKDIRRQNAIWRGETLPSDGDLDASPALDATAKDAASDAAVSKKPEARLSIATPGQSDTEGAGTAAASQAMRDQLAAAQEEADRASRENAELNSRLGDLERQLATLQRLLELKDDQLATLQGQMGQVPAPAPAPAEQAQVPEQRTPVADDGSLFDNPMIRYGLIVIALLILAVLVLRRFSRSKTEAAFESARFGEDEADFDSDQDFGDDDADEDDDPGHTTVIIEPRKKHDEVPAISAAEDDFDDLDDLLADDVDADVDVDDLDVAQPMAPIEAETDDALAEADIYVAYGRYEQAAQMLSSAIAKEPRRSDLRVKLLGVFLETRDQSNFMREFEALEALGDNDAIAEVKESMSAVEGVSGWLRADSTPVTAGSDDDASLGELDFNLDDPDEEVALADAADALDIELDEDDDLDLSSFSLDEDDDTEFGATTVFDSSPTRAETEVEPVTGVAAKAESDSDGSFDLDLDDDFSLDELEMASPVSEVDNSDTDDLGELSLDDFELDELDVAAEKPAAKAPEKPPEKAPESAPAATASELDDLSLDDELSLDEGELSLDDDELSLDDGLVLEGDAAGASAVPPASGSDDFAGLDADDMSDDLGMLGDSDEVATKLDLARAYIDMGDAEGAKEMLQEVLEEGTDDQKQDANELLGRL